MVEVEVSCGHVQPPPDLLPHLPPAKTRHEVGTRAANKPSAKCSQSQTETLMPIPYDIRIHQHPNLTTTYHAYLALVSLMVRLQL